MSFHERSFSYKYSHGFEAKLRSHLSMHGGEGEAPRRGGQNATMTICGLRTIGGEIGLLSPSKESTPAVVDTTALKHNGKRMSQQQTTRLSSPSRITWKTWKRSIVCKAAATRTPRQRNSPSIIQLPVSLAKTLTDRPRDGGRSFPQREKTTSLTSPSKIYSRISTTFPTSHLRYGGWGGSVKEIRS